MSIFDREDLKYPQASVDIRKKVLQELKTNYGWAIRRLTEVCASREFEPNKFDEYISQDCRSFGSSYLGQYEYNGYIEGEPKYPQIDIDVLEAEIKKIKTKYLFCLADLNRNGYPQLIDAMNRNKWGFWEIQMQQLEPVNIEESYTVNDVDFL